MEQLRLEIDPRKKIKTWTAPDKDKFAKFGGWGGKKLVHEPKPIRQYPQKGFLTCPHCNGAAYQEADGFIVVVSCLNCGYNRPIGVALCTQTV